MTDALANGPAASGARATAALPVPLPARILLLGSGELGRELAIAYARLGCRVVACDAYPDAPAMQVAAESDVFDMRDGRALGWAIERHVPDLVVPEVEAIATDALERVEARGRSRIAPDARAVRTTMDRQRLRELAAVELGLPTSRYAFADSLAGVRRALARVGLPAFVKPSMSSSGHGQVRVTDLSQAGEAWVRAGAGARARTGRVVVEGAVEFDQEITLLTVRWWDVGAEAVRTSVCAPIGHLQSRGDYVESWQPADVPPPALAQAESMARAVTGALGDMAPGGLGLGLFGVEFFVAGDRAIFSEVAPRPHDTGLVTLVTQHQSEFALHARATLGLPVDASLRGPGASAAIRAPGPLADVRYEGMGEALRLASDVRLFGKQATRAGRRLGVALARGADVSRARDSARGAARAIHLAAGPPARGTHGQRGWHS